MNMTIHTRIIDNGHDPRNSNSHGGFGVYIKGVRGPAAIPFYPVPEAYCRTGYQPRYWAHFTPANGIADFHDPTTPDDERHMSGH